ncbi:hypothetical protein DAPPUDRAFT_241312 [Daphnia pulex]|uniref:Uncharacterized protein n=1 Tax=Daphnia pulex TaxID=6669 RepID=E9GDY3_DAPPU|nr:hypothetical protein DAPPUDRAFT_241312 [Daphnia pulex]|eukprot:EFX82166.1 hypothetical protein DAPPUDRAFT_241312 [Daphnia pulex]
MSQMTHVNWDFKPIPSNVNLLLHQNFGCPDLLHRSPEVLFFPELQHQSVEYYTVAPKYYTINQPERVTTTYAATVYYTEARKYNSAPSYFIESPALHHINGRILHRRHHFAIIVSNHRLWCHAAVRLCIVDGWIDLWCADSPGYGEYQSTTPPLPYYTTTTFASTGYYTEAVKYYTTKASDYYTKTYVAPSYYTKTPEYNIEASNYYTTKSTEYTTKYAAPAYYTKAPHYYIHKTLEYFTSVYHGTAPPSYYTTTYGMTSYYTEAPEYYTIKASDYYTKTSAELSYYTEAPNIEYYTEAPEYLTTKEPECFTATLPPCYTTTTRNYTDLPKYYTTKAPDYYTRTSAVPIYSTEAQSIIIPRATPPRHRSNT